MRRVWGNPCAQAHMKHIVAYGVGNAKRWADGGGNAQQPGSLLDFSVGLEDRRASVRIPHSVLLQKRGWYARANPLSCRLARALPPRRRR